MSNKETKTAYLTTRILLREAKKAVKAASEDAMERMGYIVKAEDGWVVKEYKDGTIERIKQINHI